MKKDKTPPARLDEQALNDLRESEERFRNLAESTPMAILIYQDNRWIYANPSAERITGYSREELTSMNFWDVVHPDFREMVAERGKKRQSGENVISSYEFKIVTKSGEDKWVLLNGTTSRLGGKPAGLINVIDITEMKEIHEELDRRNAQLNQKNNEIQSILRELEETNKELTGLNEELMATNEEFEATNEELVRSQKELEESERRYRDIFNNFPVGIFQTTMTGDFITINNEMARILGYAAAKDSAAPGENVTQFYLDPAVRPRLMDEVRKRGYAERYETQFRKKNGAVIWVSINTFIRDREDGSAYLEGYIQDITARKEAEEEMKSLETQLIQAQKMEAVGRLAGGIAHDFNNLLTAILGNAEMALKSMNEDSGIVENINDILATALRAADLTQQLLAFSRRQVIKPVVIDINEFLGKVERLLRRIIGENITLHIRRQPGEALVRADPTLMEQVVMNLFVNARDAMPDGGTITVVSSHEVVPAARAARGGPVPPGDYIRIDVADTGIGMDHDVMENIFEPFFTTKGDLGTGLGLSTVYGIVRQNDGYITVASEKGAGSTFSVFLPRAAAAAAAEKSCEPSEPAAGVPAAARETILVVEDESHVRKLLKRTLASQGYTVLEASTSREAIGVCSAEETHIDLLLTDIVLPDLPGPQLVEKVRGSRPGMRVLYMSGYAEQRTALTELQGEGVFFIPKPFLPSDLQKKIREVLAAPC